MSKAMDSETAIDQISITATRHASTPDGPRLTTRSGLAFCFGGVKSLSKMLFFIRDMLAWRQNAACVVSPIILKSIQDEYDGICNH